MTGSPPRMRGKGPPALRRLCSTRITPAHAGKSRRTVEKRRAQWDHPRACGEKNREAMAQIREEGSPPRMRGKVGGKRKEKTMKRITPAHAGKSVTMCRAPHRVWDHPRACGEKTQRAPPGNGALGSPPRMRGKVVRRIRRRHTQGITPAHAGKSYMAMTGKKRW